MCVCVCCLVRVAGHLNQIFRDLASFMTFIRSPLIFKVEVIKPLIASFPHRKFVLVGDDGQQDPGTGRAFPAPHRKTRLSPHHRGVLGCACTVVYAEIAQEFPDQVLHIFIHHVNGTNEVLSSSCHLLLLLDEKTHSILTSSWGRPRPTG